MSLDLGPPLPSDVPPPGRAPHERAQPARRERPPTQVERLTWAVGILAHALFDYRVAFAMAAGALHAVTRARGENMPCDGDAERDVIAAALQRKLPRRFLRSLPPAAFVAHLDGEPRGVRAELWLYTTSTIETLAEAGMLTGDAGETGRMVARAYWNDDAGDVSPLWLDAERVPLMRREVSAERAREAAEQVAADHRRRVALRWLAGAALALHERGDGAAVEAMRAGLGSLAHTQPRPRQRCLRILDTPHHASETAATPDERKK